MQEPREDRLRPHVWTERLGSHLWTIGPRVRHMVRPEPAPAAETWHTVLQDPDVGPVRLSGWLRREAAAPADTADIGAAASDGDLLVLLHGLGGTVDSHYMLRGARAAAAADLSCLRLNLRGADRSGEDFYHGGLTADLHAALASADLRSFRRILLLGYSLGGHLALRYATEAGDSRVAAVAAVCAPLDLGLAGAAIDGPEGWFYRRYLLANLTRIYAAVAARRPLPMPVAEVARLRKIRDFDEHVVAPRHHFRGADDYYARASVAPHLGALRLPALLVYAAGDPMVQARAVRPVLRQQAPHLEVRWAERGGHVGFPSALDLALEGGRAAGALGVDEQVIAWLRSR